jgi:putative phage-type endonuclease
VRELLDNRRDITQQTDEWFEIRRRMVTASDVAAILGCNPYTTRTQVMRKKLGSEMRFTGNSCTRYGQENEEIAGQEYSKRERADVVTYGLMAHRDYPWLGASPDLIRLDGVIVEIKCPAVSSSQAQSEPTPCPAGPGACGHAGAQTCGRQTRASPPQSWRRGGAGAWRRFRSVTLPMLSPVILFNLIVAVIGSFQVFTQAFVMTGGEPGDLTRFYVLYLFNLGFESYEMGYASAMAWILLVVVLAMTAIPTGPMRTQLALFRKHQGSPSQGL